MKIGELYDLLGKAIEKDEFCKNCDIEFWLKLQDDEIPCYIDSIGQFSVIPDITLTVAPNSNKIYSTRELTKEEYDYKTKYDNILKANTRIINLLENTLHM